LFILLFLCFLFPSFFCNVIAGTPDDLVKPNGDDVNDSTSLGTEKHVSILKEGCEFVFMIIL